MMIFSDCFEEEIIRLCGFASHCAMGKLSNTVIVLHLGRGKSKCDSSLNNTHNKKEFV
jgi:hypothetical protein